MSRVEELRALVHMVGAALAMAPDDTSDMIDGIDQAIPLLMRLAEQLRAEQVMELLSREDKPAPTFRLIE